MDQGSLHNNISKIGSTSGPSFGANVGQYLVDWLSIAKKYHNVTVDIIGWQNEHTWQVKDVIDFRGLMDSSGFADVSLAVADCGPGPSYQTPDITGDAHLVFLC